MWKYGIRPAAGPGLSAKLGRLASGFFLAGFLAGLILIFAGQESLVQGSSFLDSVSLEGLAALQIDRRGLLLYSMRQRLLPAGILVLASAAGIGGAAAAFSAVERLLRGSSAFRSLASIRDPRHPAVCRGHFSSGSGACSGVLDAVHLVHAERPGGRENVFGAESAGAVLRQRNSSPDSVHSAGRMRPGGVCESPCFGQNASFSLKPFSHL